MNQVWLTGRLTREPEIRWTQGQDQKCTARYTLAVPNGQRKDDGTYGADFIACTAFGKSAEWVEKYLKQGTKISVNGSIRTGSYTNRDGVKVYTTEIWVRQQEFAESPNGGRAAGQEPYGGFAGIPESDTPFA